VQHRQLVGTWFFGTRVWDHERHLGAIILRHPRAQGRRNPRPGVRALLCIFILSTEKSAHQFCMAFLFRAIKCWGTLYNPHNQLAMPQFTMLQFIFLFWRLFIVYHGHCF
jgi:hypothetical protein